MSSCSTVRTDSRIRSTASPVRNTSSRSDTADWGKAIGLVSFGECLAVHTEDLADGSHIYEAAPATLNPHHSAGRPQDLSARVTQVYRRTASGWVIVHRHADPLVRPISPPQLAALMRG